MRNTILAAASILALSLGAGGTTAALAQMHGGHVGGGGAIGGGAPSMGAPSMGAAPMAAPRMSAAPAPAPSAAVGRGVTTAPNNFAAVNRNGVTRARPNTSAAAPAYAGRNRAYAWRDHDHDHDRFHHRRFAFFPGIGIYDYAGPSCYYDPNAPWPYDYYGYNNCYPDYSYSYDWD